MLIKKLNKEQNRSMKKNIVKESYEWEDISLFSYLCGELPKQPELYREIGLKLTDEQKEQNRIISEINNEISQYNQNIISSSLDMSKIDNLFNDLEKFIDKYMTSYYDIKKCAVFHKTILLSGPGGIGKSQFLYELSNKLSKDHHLTIYGKYCESVDKNVLAEIESKIKNERFYFIIDAINEFDPFSRDILLEFIRMNKMNKNLRIILSYRNYSLDDKELYKIKSIVDEEEIFTGVSADNALEKISQKYNLDISVYSRLLYDNNPLHLKMVIKSICDNQLNTRNLKPITKGTYIYEHFIKDVLSLKEWKLTKKILDSMVSSQVKRISINNLKNILGYDTLLYIQKMKENQFIDSYISEGVEYFFFINETLTDYLIARHLFEQIKNMSEPDIILYINNIIDVFVTIHIPIILLLFEKYRNDIKTVIRIINDSHLNNYLELSVFNEVMLTNENMKEIIKYLKPQLSLREILKIAGGNENNPYNCTNYINTFMTNRHIKHDLNYSKYEKKGLRYRVKIYAQSISRFNYDDNYLREKLYFGLYLSSIPDKILRALCEKMLFEIINSDASFIKELINFYKKYEDEYIHESIIHVLSSFHKNNLLIKKFFNEINDYNLISQSELCYIDHYLYGEENYIKYSKKNLLDYKDIRKNLKILRFIKRVFFINKYDYNFFKFDDYSEKIHFKTKFLSENKSKILEVNNYIKKNFTCLDYNDSCHPSYFKELIIDKKFKISNDVIDDETLYLAWQNVFKGYLKKQKIKIRDLEKMVVTEELNKGVVYKLLDLSFSKIAGSISCNYYTNSFQIYDYNKGYQQNYFDVYQEKHQVFYPISVYSETIENLDNKLAKRLQEPEIKDINWANDYSISMQNIFEIIKPIKYKNEEWIPIYGSIRFSERADNEYGFKWNDNYIFNMAVDEKYNLISSPDDDRKYTIETETYNGNINEVYNRNYSQTTSLNNSSDCKEEFLSTDFNIPPTSIINYYNLCYCNSTSSWNNQDNQVLLINNNEGIWYNNGVTGSIYFRKKYFDEFIKSHDYKYFCFTEKFHPMTGYSSESAMQVQIDKDNNVHYYKHYKENNKYNLNNEKCKDCIVFIQQREDEKNFDYDLLL